jgi:hypothetical protein
MFDLERVIQYKIKERHDRKVYYLSLYGKEVEDRLEAMKEIIYELYDKGNGVVNK